MEQDKQNLLEMIDRPAFLVRNGVIRECNQMARNRQIFANTAIGEYLTESAEAYRDFQGGILYLTLQIGWIPCGATVMKQTDGDLFLLDLENDQSQLQVLALAAQQLRVPLSNVMTLADCLFPELKEETHREKAAQITRALFQLMRQISNMADAERYAEPDRPFYENTELCRFFRDIFEKAQTTLEDTTVSLRFTCPDATIFTAIDRERMERAVYNLISNAVKFSPPASCINASLKRAGKLAYLTVTDQGEGIAAHVQSSLFRRYLREPAIEDSRFGLGLGMTLVRSVASVHGGTVLLEQSGGTKVVMSMAIRKDVPGTLRSPNLRIGDYAGGRNLGLLELSETLPASSYEKEI